MSKHANTPRIFPPVTKREFGAHIEGLVREHLEQQNLNCIAANYTKKCGEIDLVFEDAAGSILFIEVRFRAYQHYGGAHASVDRSKAMKLKRTAAAFLQQYKLTERVARIDVVAVAPKDAKRWNNKRGLHSSQAALPILSELDIDWIINAVED